MRKAGRENREQRTEGETRENRDDSQSIFLCPLLYLGTWGRYPFPLLASPSLTLVHHGLDTFPPSQVLVIVWGREGGREGAGRRRQGRRSEFG